MSTDEKKAAWRKQHSDVDKMSKEQLQAELHAFNPYAGYTSAYGERLSLAALRATLRRYRNLRP